MKIKDVKRWHYFVSWDNPMPADSSALLRALRRLGKVTALQTKTSIALSPKPSTSWQDVRAAIKTNLSKRNGKAFYVNLKSSLGFEIGRVTKFKWRRVS